MANKITAVEQMPIGIDQPNPEPEQPPEPPHFAQLRAISDRAGLGARQLDVQAIGHAVQALIALLLRR